MWGVPAPWLARRAVNSQGVLHCGPPPCEARTARAAEGALPLPWRLKASPNGQHLEPHWSHLESAHQPLVLVGVLRLAEAGHGQEHQPLHRVLLVLRDRARARASLRTLATPQCMAMGHARTRAGASAGRT